MEGQAGQVASRCWGTRGEGGGQMLGLGIGKRDGTDVQHLQTERWGRKQGWLNGLVNDGFGVTLFEIKLLIFT